VSALVCMCVGVVSCVFVCVLRVCGYVRFRVRVGSVVLCKRVGLCSAYVCVCVLVCGFVWCACVFVTVLARTCVCVFVYVGSCGVRVCL